MVQIEPITPAHIEYLSQNICEDDRREVLGLGFTVNWALKHSIETALESACILWNGIPVVILGVGQVNPFDEEYTPWLLATDELPKHPVKVMKYTYLILRRWISRYGKLSNYVDSRHTRAVEWLQALGAEMELHESHGPYGRPYYKFTFGG